ncbi:uncharacterized protein ACRADG_003215 [Cochliomyia hominivorax]
MVLNPRCDVWEYFDNIVEEGVAVCKLCKQRLKNERSYCLRKHIKKLHNPKSLLWNYYDNIVDENVAVCKICNKRVRNNRLFNLTLHLSKKHDIHVDNDNGNRSKESVKIVKSQNNVGTESIEGAKDYLCIELEEKTFVESIMGLLIDENVAPKIFATKNMQRIISPVCDALSKRENITLNVDDNQSEKAITSLSSYIRDEFGNELNWRMLSLTIDMDLYDTIKLLCLRVQFIENSQIESRALGVINLEDEQQLTGSRIVKILTDFNIELNQIVRACWDNTKMDYNLLVSNTKYLEEIHKFQKTRSLHVAGLSIECYVGVIAQLCMLDVLKNPTIHELFMECRTLIYFINNNLNILSKEFEDKNLKLPQLDSPWKWGSTYNMINNLNDCLHVLETTVEVPYRLNDNLKNFIGDFCKSLNFLQKSINKFYQEELLFGDFYAQWLKCRILTEKLLKANKHKGNYLEIILLELLKSIENRSNELLNHDYHKACLYLDPRFQHTLSKREKIFAVDYLNQIWNVAKIYNSDLQDPVTVIKTTTNSSIQFSDSEDDDVCLNKFLFQSAQINESTGIYKKLEELKLPFQMANTNILAFWNDYKCKEPQIYTLAKICFAIPATQIYDKIQFPHYKRLKNATDLQPHHKENLTLIHLNEHLVNQAKETLVFFKDDFSDFEMTDDENSNGEIQKSTERTSDISETILQIKSEPSATTSTGTFDIGYIKMDIDI